MGKHYVDPKDKPALSNAIVGYAGWHLLQTALERNKPIYAMQKPPNRITDEPTFCVFYLTRLGAVNTIAVHNCGKVNKVNEGNPRKARLLVYQPAEIKAYFDSKEKQDEHIA